MKFLPLVQGALLAPLFLLPTGTGDARVPRFVDRTEEARLDVVTYSGGKDKNHILESTGNGVLVFDYDLDGFQDVYFVNAYRLPRRGEMEPHRSVLYRNNQDGTFTDVTAAAGVGAAMYGHGGSVGDIDGDGLPDLYLTAFGPNLLFRNNGDGTFSDRTEAAGTGDPGWSIGATFFDADGDGDQDLYVANYIRASWEEVHSARRTRRWRGKVEVLDGPKGLLGSSNTFYLNNGDGTFREATLEAGLTDGGEYYSMGVMSFDYDGDGDQDLYVANDSTPNCLYRNRGNGTFEEVATPTGSGFGADGQTQGSMGVHFGDYDGDGRFDLIVTNFANDYYTLYRNLGGELFLDDSFSTGIAVPTFVPLGWGTFFFDADNDTDLDLFFSNGHIYPQVDDDPTLNERYRQKNQLLLNEGGKFRDVSERAGEPFSLELSSRGAAYADLDNDGDLDILVSNQDAGPSYLENRTASDHHWVLLELADTLGDRQALGARVTLTAGELTQYRQVVSGGSYASQNDLRLHFGLGDAERVDQLVILWPDGKGELHRDLSSDRLYCIKRGESPFEVPPFSINP
ncbi:MAG: CRTAC1 family protein [Acidobacteriota bacterium]